MLALIARIEVPSCTRFFCCSIPTAAYFSLVDFDLPVWFALGTSLWSDTLGKWTVGRPSVLGQFPPLVGATTAYRFRVENIGDAPAAGPILIDDAKAPDFARCVDIHRKYGYDPVELFVDPALRFPRLRIAAKLLRKTLGFRMLMDVIPLDPSLVRGSHGTCPADPDEWPVLIGTGAAGGPIPATAVRDRLLAACLAT